VLPCARRFGLRTVVGDSPTWSAEPTGAEARSRARSSRSRRWRRSCPPRRWRLPGWSPRAATPHPRRSCSWATSVPTSAACRDRRGGQPGAGGHALPGAEAEAL